MASTYVNDLRLNEMATGDASGTWGDTTNTNLELIGEALGFGTEAITTNADTHTSTVADGATDPVRAMYVKYTGSLDSACTITIAPNTINRMQFIENGTSGSQNIIISQGTGANVTIAPGDAKAVYLDGAGSGAAVTDAFASLSVVDLKVQDDLTLTSDSAVITFGVDGDTTLTHTDGSGLTLNSTNKIMFNDASQFIQGSSATVLALGATDEIDLTATAIDVNGTMDVSGAITSSAGATITTADNTNSLSLISTDADANVGPVLRLFRNSSSPADNDQIGSIRFSGEDDGGTETNYAQIDAYAKDVTDGTEDALIVINSMVAGTSRARARIDFAETVFNSDSVDLDFRVESDGNANMLFVDGGNDNVLLGTQNQGHMRLNQQLGMAVTGNVYGGISMATHSSSAGGNRSLLDFNRSRNTTIGSHTVVQSGDSLGTIVGRGDDGDEFLDAASIDFEVDATPGNGDMPGRILFSTTADGANSVSERMRITSAGLIGMGDSPNNLTSEIVTITTPSSGGGQGIAFKRLDTNTDQVCGQIRWSNNATDDLAFIKVNTDGASASSTMQFFTNTGSGIAERMRVNSSGQFLLGTTSNNSDTYKMIVDGGGGSKGIDVRNISYNADNGAFRSVPSGNTTYLFAAMLNSSNSTVGSIVVTSAGTTYNTSSDYRLKENITPLENGLDRLNQLKPVNFNWIESGKEEEGFIAHEVKEVFPYAVTGEKDTVKDDGTVSPQTMDYGRITPLLVKAIQEQQEQIEQLKTEISKLH